MFLPEILVITDYRAYQGTGQKVRREWPLLVCQVPLSGVEFTPNVLKRRELAGTVTLKLNVVGDPGRGRDSGDFHSFPPLLCHRQASVVLFGRLFPQRPPFDQILFLNSL